MTIKKIFGLLLIFCALNHSCTRDPEKIIPPEESKVCRATEMKDIKFNYRYVYTLDANNYAVESRYYAASAEGDFTCTYEYHRWPALDIAGLL